MTAIVVTGAAGFIGRHLCDAALRAGLTVRRMTRESFDMPCLADSLAGAAVVVHLAGRTPYRKGQDSDPDRAYREDNVELTGRVADACRVAGVGRLIFVSSAGVLGFTSPPGGLNDFSPTAPCDGYTRSKLAAEDLLLSKFAPEMEIVIVRPPTVYGPGAGGNFRRICRAAALGIPLPFGAVNAQRSMISVRNLCDVLLVAIRAPKVAGRPMLVADAETISVGELASLLSALSGRRPRLFSVPRGIIALGLRLAGHEEYLTSLFMPFVINGSAARDFLGWTPRNRLQDEMRWAFAGADWADRKT